MHRPGNLRGIGRLGNWRFGADLNPIVAMRTNRDWQIQPAATTPVAPPPQWTATPNATGYTLVPPTAPVATTPVLVSQPAPIAPITTATVATTPTSTATVSQTQSPPPTIASLINSSNTASTASTSATSSSSSSSASAPSATASASSPSASSVSTSSPSATSATTEPSSVEPVGLEARYSYTVPIPGYNYPLPGIDTYSAVTSQYSQPKETAVEVRGSINTKNKYLWDKPGVQWVAVAVLVGLVLKKDLF